MANCMRIGRSQFDFDDFRRIRKRDFMKRSEMLEILNDAIIESGISEKLYNHVDSLDFVLKKLEEAGMKPPVKKRCPVLLTDTHVWEPENAESR